MYRYNSIKAFLLPLFFALMLAACQLGGGGLPSTGGGPAVAQQTGLAAGGPLSSPGAYPSATQLGESTELVPASGAASPIVAISQQPIKNGMLMVSEVVSNQPGWVVIHAQLNNQPGPVIGYAPVRGGINSNLMVGIDAAKATSFMYAVINQDAGKVGVFEFPGPDSPLTDNLGQVIMKAFQITGPIPTVITPSITIVDQPLLNDTLTIPAVISAGPSWLAIQTQAAGRPGPVLGETLVKQGLNSNAVIKINAAQSTNVLYAVLHIDAGRVGVFEFPGPDVPALADGQPVSLPFYVLPDDSTPAPSSYMPAPSGPIPGSEASGASGTASPGNGSAQNGSASGSSSSPLTAASTSSSESSLPGNPTASGTTSTLASTPTPPNVAAPTQTPTPRPTKKA